MLSTKKYLIHSLLILTLCVLSAFSHQANDCVFYFATQKGSKLEMTNYNRKGKKENVIKLEVVDKKTVNGNVTLDIAYVYYDKKEKDVQAKGNYKAMCENGVYKFEFGAMSPAAGQKRGKNMEMKMESDFLDIPNNPRVGQKLKDGKMQISMGTEGMANMFKTQVKITDRKVDGVEKITTPAGTFDCVKISYNSQMKMSFMNTRTKTVQWFAKNVGMVRSETYNKRGKLSGYTELTKFSK
ncbi:MAG TPA: hypothetical protein DCS93_37150 [Microscillaceae bacterium]|nr:hypothetical protein [Microscillaceae bacterium]